MTKRTEQDGSSGHPLREVTSRQAKRPYRTPRLVTYGSLRELALVKGGTLGDGGGKPVSKA